MTPSPRSPAAALAAVAGRWPTLLAWFVAGWLARVLLLRLAGHAGNVDAVWGLLVLPLAVLARLVSYVAIFVVVRDALLGSEQGEAGGRGFARVRRSGRQLGASLVEAVLPFLVIYAAWSIIEEDIVAYARASLDIDQLAAEALSVSLGVLSVSMVVVAFGLRLLLSRLEDRLPRWTEALSVYLEAVWVLVTVLVLRTLLGGAPEWLGSRRMVAWSLDRLDDLRESFSWFGRLVDGLGPVWSVVSDVVLLPMAWLALAGVVFARTLAERASSHDPHHVTRVRERVDRLPSRWRRLVALASRAVVERWEPVRRVVTLAWRAGPLPLAAYLLAFALVAAAPVWLELGFAHVVGPHEVGWWSGTSAIVGFGVDVVVVPVQLTVVAVALFYLSGRAESRHRAPAAVPVAAGSTR